MLLFTWSSLSFTCVLARATQRFVMFKPDGTPVRARLTVTFSQYSNAELEAKEVKRETADYTKVHVVRQGETLAQHRRARPTATRASGGRSRCATASTTRARLRVGHAAGCCRSCRTAIRESGRVYA